MADRERDGKRFGWTTRGKKGLRGVMTGKALTSAPGKLGMTRQERFCRNLVLHEMTLIDAYREAFTWRGGHKAAENAARTLLSLPVVQQRLRELRTQAFPVPNGGRSMLTLEEHLGELALIQREAAIAGQYGAAVAAAIARGKACGLYVERSVTAKVTLEELIAASRRPISITSEATTRLHTEAAEEDE